MGRKESTERQSRLAQTAHAANGQPAEVTEKVMTSLKSVPSTWSP